MLLTDTEMPALIQRHTSARKSRQIGKMARPKLQGEHISALNKKRAREAHRAGYKTGKHEVRALRKAALEQLPETEANTAVTAVESEEDDSYHSYSDSNSESSPDLVSSDEDWDSLVSDSELAHLSRGEWMVDDLAAYQEWAATESLDIVVRYIADMCQ